MTSAERTAETVAANLESWAAWIERFTTVVRMGTGKLADECPVHLRDAAAWIREQHPTPIPVTGPAEPIRSANRCSMGMGRSYTWPTSST